MNQHSTLIEAIGAPVLLSADQAEATFRDAAEHNWSCCRHGPDAIRSISEVSAKFNDWLGLVERLDWPLVCPLPGGLFPKTAELHYLAGAMNIYLNNSYM